MTRISKTKRATIRAYLAEHTDYDASTLRIVEDGLIVTARKDADKTLTP